MTDHDSERRQAMQEAPGGRSSRGPEYGKGGEPQVPVPPYDELRGEPNKESAEGVRRAFDADNAPEPGPAPPVSAEERAGVTGTETDPEPALGVGRSRGGRAEDQAPDRGDVGRKGDRPVGTVAGDSEGVGAQEPRDPRSPHLQSGDQGS